MRSIAVGLFFLAIAGCERMKHSEKPQTAAEMPADFAKQLAALKSSPYYAETRALVPHVRGKTVHETDAGHSGYIVRFDDNTYVVVFLRDGFLRWTVGTGVPTMEHSNLVRSPSEPNLSGPTAADRPYASEANDIRSEVAKCRGKKAEGLSYGEDTFNLTFPGGMELEAMLLPSAGGVKGLRVYWEQW